MEIERKWMVKGWPEGLPLREEFAMRQGYISVRPTVRIREEALTGGRTDYILCFKSGGGLAREEIERSIDKELFDDLEYKIIAKPLIPKLRRSYTLPDGSVLEVNHVDEGQPTEFWYAEVEYPTVESALAWQPESCGLGDYLKDEVTNQPGQSMGEYWVETEDEKSKTQTGTAVQLPGDPHIFPAVTSGAVPRPVDGWVDDDASVLCLPLLAEGPAVLHPAVRPCAGPCQLGPLSE